MKCYVNYDIIELSETAKCRHKEVQFMAIQMIEDINRRIEALKKDQKIRILLIMLGLGVENACDDEISLADLIMNMLNEQETKLVPQGLNPCNW